MTGSVVEFELEDVGPQLQHLLSEFDFPGAKEFSILPCLEIPKPCPQ